MDTNWHVVLLDGLLLTVWIAQGFLYAGDFRHWRFALMGAGYWIAAAGIATLMLGDVALALGYTAEDHWFLAREWRALPWRYAAALGFWLKALLMRFAFETEARG